MLKKILIGLAVIIVILCVVIATRPDSVHVQRSANMNAPPAAVYNIVSDFHHWAEWSPWDKMDPNMKKTFEGGPGMGAKYSWVGNEKVGEGRMTIIEAQFPEKVGITLEFLKPYPMTSKVTLTMKSAPTGTQVTWAMDAPQNFMAKAFGLFMNMDDMVGKDFEQGLANLNAASSAEAKKQADEAAAKAAAAAAAASPSPAPSMPPAAPPPAKHGKKK
jgi:uncharacterized protein YndB with AHSA1/START domain